MRFRPDPTFYPSPRMAMEAPPERMAYVTAIDANAALGRPGGHDALAAVDLDPGSPELRHHRVHRRGEHASATSCTTRAGTRAARRCVPTPRTRTWSGAT